MFKINDPTCMWSSLSLFLWLSLQCCYFLGVLVSNLRVKRLMSFIQLPVFCMIILFSDSKQIHFRSPGLSWFIWLLLWVGFVMLISLRTFTPYFFFKIPFRRKWIQLRTQLYLRSVEKITASLQVRLFGRAQKLGMQSLRTAGYSNPHTLRIESRTFL